MDRTIQGNAKRSDLGAILSNLAFEPKSYLNYGTGFAEQVPEILKDTIQGAIDQPKTGNLVNDLTGSLRGATGGTLTGLQTGLAEATGKVLRGK